MRIRESGVDGRMKIERDSRFYHLCENTIEEQREKMLTASEISGLRRQVSGNDRPRIFIPVGAKKRMGMGRTELTEVAGRY